MRFRAPGVEAHVDRKHEPGLLPIPIHLFEQRETRTELRQRLRDASEIPAGVAHDEPRVAPCSQVAGVGALEGFACFFDG